MKTKVLSVLTLALMLGFGANAQSIIASWTFDVDTCQGSKFGGDVYFSDAGVEDNSGRFIASEDAEGTILPVEFKNGAAKYSAWDNGANEKAVTIKFTPLQATDLTLTFQLASGGENNADQRAPKDWAVQYEDDNDTWIGIDTIELSGYDFETFSYNLPAYFDEIPEGDKVSIRWIMLSNDAVGGSTVAVDGSLKMDSVVIAGLNPVALEGLESQVEASVYPNPASEVITVACDEAIAEVEILTLSGTVVKTIFDNFSAVAISDLAVGVYVVKTTAVSQTTYVNTILVK